MPKKEKMYDVKITPIALEDLENIYNYIYQEQEEPQIANKLIETIEEKILSLEFMPQKFVLCKEEILRKKGYRKLIVKNYIAFYLIDEENKRVIIARVLYGARDYEKLL